MSATETFLDPTAETVTALMARGIEGPVVMLNLLRLRDQADYTDFADLAPPAPITGREAYQRYVEHTLPYLHASGGELTFLGEGGTYLIGPNDEGWDIAMLIRQSSIQSFLAFASDPEYMAGIGHRVAAVVDSRILPLVEAPAS